MLLWHWFESSECVLLVVLCFFWFYGIFLCCCLILLTQSQSLSRRTAPFVPRVQVNTCLTHRLTLFGLRSPFSVAFLVSSILENAYQGNGGIFPLQCGALCHYYYYYSFIPYNMIIRLCQESRLFAWLTNLKEIFQRDTLPLPDPVAYTQQQRQAQTLFVTCAEYNKCRPYREMLTHKPLTNRVVQEELRKYLPNKIKLQIMKSYTIT